MVDDQDGQVPLCRVGWRTKEGGREGGREGGVGLWWWCGGGADGV